MLCLTHNLLSDQLGVKKTKEKVSQLYYWFQMKDCIKSCIRKLDVCAADKLPAKTPKAPVGLLRTGAPWDTLALGLFGPFPCSAHGNWYKLMKTDNFTKYVEIIDTLNQQAEDCAVKVVNNFIVR